MKKKRRRMLEKVIVKQLLILLIPTVTMLIFSNLYAVYVAQGKVDDSYRGTMHLYMNQYDQVLSDTERYLLNLIYTLDQKYPVRVDEGDRDQFERQIEIVDMLEQANQINVNVDGFFTYNIVKDQYISDYKDVVRNSGRLAIQDYTESQIRFYESGKSIPKSFELINLDGEPYLYRVLHVTDYYAGVMIKADSMLEGFRGIEIAQNERVNLATGRDDSIYKAMSIDNHTLLTVESKFDDLILIMSYESVSLLSDLNVVVAVILLLSLFSLILIPFVLHKVMDEVVKEQLSKQQAELQFLELQINPHFYMNALNIIHTMAELEDYSSVKEMTLYLVKHFRYVLSTRGRQVSVGEEIEFVLNYLAIQELRYDHSIFDEVEVAPDLYEHLIPPMVIQSFVENSIKFAFKSSGKVEIRITVKRVDDKTIRIRIEDTGTGYPDYVLEAYNKREVIKDDRGEHFGINNVLSRLGIIYGEKAQLRLYNSESGGACSDILIPLKNEERGHDR